MTLQTIVRYRFLAALCGIFFAGAAMAQEAPAPRAPDGSIEALAKANAAELEELTAAAEGGDAAAQYKLGWRYYGGNGVPKDAAEAYQWWSKSAAQNFAAAENGVGYIHRYGLGGVAKDDKEALTWYRKAADQGYPEAQGNMGRAYYNGLGVEKDPVEAVKWYQKAADQGFVGGQAGLAQAYRDGVGVTKDPMQAYLWYGLAAKKGDADAIKNRDELEKTFDPAQLAEARKKVNEWKPAAPTAPVTAPEAAQPPVTTTP